MNKIIELIKRDSNRVEAINQVQQLMLPQCYIAAGFIRNLVWDAIHRYTSPTPLNDVDVIYFDPAESDRNTCLKYEKQLQQTMPHFQWQVRNQAYLHERNGDKPYCSSIHAMSFWPEKETAVAIRQKANREYELVSSFGFESLWAGCITYNPRRTLSQFEERLNSKNWLARWPQLCVVRECNA